MRVAVMQPYFLPYIGYFQLMRCADIFVIHDTLKFVKGGWINRNRVLRDGQPAWLTLPLRKASDYTPIDERVITADFNPDAVARSLRQLYAKAPFFPETFSVLEEILDTPERNLFHFLHRSLKIVTRTLDLDASKIVPYNTLELSQYNITDMHERLIATCRHFGADTYINPPGGTALYDPERFAAAGITLQFLQPDLTPYRQFGHDFVPALSILDMMMFNSRDALQDHLSRFSVRTAREAAPA